jgi:hypothetical protein
MMHIKSAIARRLVGGTALLVLLATSAGAAEPPFRHRPHEKIACLTCHEREDGHGAVKITIAADCTGCHHARSNLNVCGSCHTQSKLAAPLARTFTFKTSTAKAAQARTLRFDHTQHAATQCVACHAPTANMRVVQDCGSCHREHHQELRNCSSCHPDAGKVAAHDARSHLGCGGAGCHQDEVTASLRTQRNVCLTCHSNMAEHQPGGDCASCHMIPKEKR